MGKFDLKLQVKSSGYFLNILDGGSDNAKEACQGTLDGTINVPPNFLWEIIPSTSNPGWCLIQVKSSLYYLNIYMGGTVNGTKACQGILDDPESAPDNFLWKIIPSTSNPGWCLIQVKSSLYYLNIDMGGTFNGKKASQGILDDPESAPDNFLWLQNFNDPKKVNVTLNIIDSDALFAIPDETTLSDAQANQCLSMEDDNRGIKEDPINQSSFRSILNAGSEVTWKTNILGKKDGYSAGIEDITYEPNTGTGQNILGPVSQIGQSGKVQADVSWNTIPPSQGDNEGYTIKFQLVNNQDTHNYYFDPKLKVDPSK